MTITENEAAQMNARKLQRDKKMKWHLQEDQGIG